MVGAACFTVVEFNAKATAPRADDDVSIECFLCNRRTKLAHMRAHVGQHILHHMYQLADDSLVRNVCDTQHASHPLTRTSLMTKQISENPCGFCGGDECSTVMTIDRGHRVTTSNCPYRYEFRYGAAVSTKSACTNVPVHCPHCKHQSRQPTLWKYNAIHHVQTQHADLVSQGTAALDRTLLLAIQIGREEEKKMGIPPEPAEEFHNTHRALLLGSEDLSSIKSESEPTKSGSKRSKKRPQAVLEGKETSGIPTKRKRVG